MMLYIDVLALFTLQPPRCAIAGHPRHGSGPMNARYKLSFWIFVRCPLNLKNWSDSCGLRFLLRLTVGKVPEREV